MPRLTKDFYVPFRALWMPKVGISKIIHGCMRAREYSKTGKLRKTRVYLSYNVNVEIASH